MRRTDALIVGGGPAGSAAGLWLAKGGVGPRLLERSSGPHDVVCGGFLSWDTLALLRRLDLEPEALGARPIHALRLVSAERTIEVRLPHAAAGLSRRRLDEALLTRAAETGVEIIRGKTVRSVDLEARTLSLDDGQEIGAEALFLANGKHELRGSARLPAADRRNSALGLRIALQPSDLLDRALAGMLELHLFDGGYAGLLAQEDGSINLCLSVARSRLNAAGGIDPMLARLADEHPRLGDRLVQPKAGEWAAIAGVPYGWRARQAAPGVFRLGDQAAVIASLAGDGIAIALRSGIEAASAFLGQGPGAAAGFQRRFRSRAALPLKAAGFLRWSAERAALRRPLMALIDAVPAVAGAAARLTRID